LLAAAKEGKLPIERVRSSLKHIASMKAGVQPPLPFDRERFNSLAERVAQLNKKLNYTYGGTIK